MANLPTVQSFKYIGSTIDRGVASKEMDNRVTKALSKWRELSGVICDKKSPTKLKLLIYHTVIRPTLLYGCETWPMSVKYEKRIGNNIDENGAMCNGSEPARTPEKSGDLGRSKVGSDSDRYETEKAGTGWTRQKKR